VRDVTGGAGRRRRVIKKVAGHGHHGGAWKVAYADFVTAMMALFMIMWLLASTDQKSREEISRYFRSGILPEGSLAMNSAAQITPSVIERAPVPPPPGSETLEDDVDKLRAKIEDLARISEQMARVTRRVSIAADDRGIVIEVVDDKDGGLLFDSSSSELKPALAQFLALLGPAIGEQAYGIEITGHTDAVPYAARARKSNWDLSYERAAAARAILETNGVRSTQVRGVIGRGAAEPFVPADPYSASNRRLSIVLLVPPPARAP
jgi:chemotaxis protein MotB